MQDVLGDSHLSPLLKASWQAAVLILLVLGLQRVFGRRLSPGWRYGLWLLVVIRLALPWTVPSPISLFNFMNRISTPIAGARATPASRVSPAPVGKEDSSGEGDEVKPAAAAPRFGWVVSWP